MIMGCAVHSCIKSTMLTVDTTLRHHGQGYYFCVSVKSLYKAADILVLPQ